MVDTAKSPMNCRCSIKSGKTYPSKEHTMTGALANKVEDMRTAMLHEFQSINTFGAGVTPDAQRDASGDDLLSDIEFIHLEGSQCVSQRLGRNANVLTEVRARKIAKCGGLIGLASGAPVP